MPDTDGISVQEWAANGQLNMPVVMMSGTGPSTPRSRPRASARSTPGKRSRCSEAARGQARAAAPAGARRAVGADVMPFIAPCPARVASPAREIVGSSRVLLLRVGAGRSPTVARTRNQPTPPGRPRRRHRYAASTSPSCSPPRARRGVRRRAGSPVARAAAKELAFALDRPKGYDLRLMVATDRSLRPWSARAGRRGAARLFEVSLAPPSIADVREDSA